MSLQGLLEGRWPSHCVAIASAVSSLQLVARCEDGKTAQRFFAVLLDASDKTGQPQQQASLVILTSAIEQAADEQLASTGERLPTRLIAVIKTPTTAASRVSAAGCWIVFVSNADGCRYFVV